MANELATRSAAVEAALIRGDLSRLTEPERVDYYLRVCQSIGVNYLTKPFDYLELEDGKDENGQKRFKLILYANRSCSDQLRSNNGVSVRIVERRFEDGLCVVVAAATTPDGRTDESIGAVSIDRENGEWKTANSGKRYFAGTGTFTRLSGEAFANAVMKAETKAKRRVTLSICGLGWIDESEVESIPTARRGEIVSQQPVGGDPGRPALPAAGRNPNSRSALFNEASQALRDCVAVGDPRRLLQVWKLVYKDIEAGKFSPQEGADLTAIKDEVKAQLPPIPAPSQPGKLATGGAAAASAAPPTPEPADPARVAAADALYEDCRELFGDEEVHAYLGLAAPAGLAALAAKELARAEAELRAWKDSGEVPARLRAALTAAA